MTGAAYTPQTIVEQHSSSTAGRFTVSLTPRFGSVSGRRNARSVRPAPARKLGEDNRLNNPSRSLRKWSHFSALPIPLRNRTREPESPDFRHNHDSARSSSTLSIRVPLKHRTRRLFGPFGLLGRVPKTAENRA